MLRATVLMVPSAAEDYHLWRGVATCEFALVEGSDGTEQGGASQA